MSRPLRIEYPGAWYHVMNRRRRSEYIFLDKHDYLMFIDLLIEVSGMCNVNIAAYCLMTNHIPYFLQLFLWHTDYLLELGKPRPVGGGKKSFA